MVEIKTVVNSSVAKLRINTLSLKNYIMRFANIHNTHCNLFNYHCNTIAILSIPTANQINTH